MEFIGKNHAVQKLVALAKRVADMPATVLITGETGTGKEILARYIHDCSSRSSHLFTPINCGAVSEGLAESELFGHVEGAFTGTAGSRDGIFAATNGGTLFLDEIAESSLSLQGKFLRVLQSGEYRPVGSDLIKRCDVRVIAATNRNLKDMIHDKEFREDLFYRLNILTLELPPLRNRIDDIPILTDFFIERFCRLIPRSKMSITDEALDKLLQYHFPGNIRQLDTIVCRAIILSTDNLITSEHLPPEVNDSSSNSVPRSMNYHQRKEETLQNFERNYLFQLMKASNGVLSKAATLGNINVKNLRKKLKEHGIDPAEFKQGT